MVQIDEENEIDKSSEDQSVGAEDENISSPIPPNNDFTGPTSINSVAPLPSASLHVSFSTEEITSESATIDRSIQQHGDDRNSNRFLRPGAFYDSNIAVGQIPAWARRRLADSRRNGIWDSQRRFSSEGSNLSIPNDSFYSSSVVATVVDEEELENAVRADLIRTSTAAEVVSASDVFVANEQRIDNRQCWIYMMALIILVIGVLFALLVTVSVENNEDDLGVIIAPTMSPTLTLLPTLASLNMNGILRCGIVHEETNLSVETYFCRALAAAVFGNSSQVQFVQTSYEKRWKDLADREIDVLTALSSHTMERDVNEGGTQVGFSFTAPLFFDGLQFGGHSFEVDCCDNLDVYFPKCASVRICAPAGTTIVATLRDIVPDFNIVEAPNDKLLEYYKTDKCNVIAHIRWTLAPYEKELNNGSDPGGNEFIIGENLFSKEPTSLVTRQDDQQWSYFVRWIVQAVFAAEELNISSKTANDFVPARTTVFGEQYQDMFTNAIEAVGSYKDMYDKILRNRVPRTGLNLPNNGSTGLIFSLPLGSIRDTQGLTPSNGSLLYKILQRGFIRCGNTIDQHIWMDLGMEYCYALAASLFGGDRSKIEFVNKTTETDAFQALNDHKVDVISGVPITLQADVNETTTGKGYTFSQPYFYENFENQIFQISRSSIALVTREDDAQWSDFVFWIVSCTFFAEERAITKARSTDMPLVNLFGSNLTGMFQHAISAVGNYGEMFNRTVKIPRQMRNKLNVNPFGPQQHSLFGY